MKEKIVVIYHGDCLDGFGGAFAAWKKFGDTAFYFPAKNRDTPGIDLVGKEVYIIDFSYPKEVLMQIEKEAKRFVILDHHISAKEAVESVREHIFDNDHSGAVIAWNYFHPKLPLPKLLAYVQDGDLWKNELPNWAQINACLSTINFDLKTWDKLSQEFENEKTFSKHVETGKYYSDYFNFVCEGIVKRAELVMFEGYKILAVNVPYLFESAVGSALAKKQPPLSMLWGRKNGGWYFSLRGNGSVDVSEIAKRYGGGGHKDAAAFRLPYDKPLPFSVIPKSLA